MFASLITTVVDFNQSVFRNIHTIVTSEDLLDDLSEDPESRACGENLVYRLHQAYDYYPPVIGRPFTYGVAISPDGSGSTINSRFSDGAGYGVWYGSLKIITTIYETIFHWLRFLADAGMDNRSVIAERRVFKVDVAAILVDLRGKEGEYPEIISCTSYDFTHRLGNYLYQAGQEGLLVPSARDIDGTNIAAFTPEILSDPRHQIYLSYMLDDGTVKVTADTTHVKKWIDLDQLKVIKPAFLLD